eukprot:976662-Amphidinium_carterae.1
MQQKSQSGLSSRKRKQTLPRGLEGCQAVTSRGEPICFLYNLGRCPNKVSGNRCPKGLHVCAKPGCQQNRSARSRGQGGGGRASSGDGKH